MLGSSGPFQYRVFVVNGLNALGFSAQGVRGGRQKGGRANAVDLAVAGRLDEHAEAARRRAVERFDLRPWIERHREVFEGRLA